MKAELNPEIYRQIDEEIGSLEGGYFGRSFSDGAFDLAEYGKSKPRILWILKEAVGDYGAYRYDSELLAENNRNRSFCRTLCYVAYVSYGILENKDRWNDIPGLYEGPSEALSRIAIINVNKLLGKVTSQSPQIVEAYDRNKGLVKKQIEFYDPDIVILGFPEACSSIVYDIIGGEKYHTSLGYVGDCAYINRNGRKFIWHYHPARPGNGARYVEEILSASTV